MRPSLALVLAGLVSGALSAAPQEPSEPVDFQKQIQPILVAHCIECHGVDEPEADLRLDVRAGVFPVDPDFPIVVPGKPDESLLFERITLPADDPDIMPADGDPLTEEQVALIRTWIEQGADWPATADAAVAAATAAPEQTALVLPELDDAARAARDAALDALRVRGAFAQQVAANTPAVEVSFGLLGEEVTDDDLKLLAGLESTLVWLDLSRTKVTDHGVARLAGFPQLRRLNLANTGVTAAALASLGNAPELHYLNLYGTQVGDDAVAHLGKLGNLQKLFLWQSKVSDAGADQLEAALPRTRIDRGRYVEVMREVAEATTPINAKCLLQDKDVDPAYIVEHDGKVIGFCCAKCKAKFTADPTPFAAKIAELAGPATAKPVNDVCPVSGEAAKPEHTSSFDGKLVAFCCKRCKAKFDAEPAAFAAKIGGAPAPATAKPVNDVCPVSGEAAKPEHTSSFDGKLVAFCCKRCKAKFDAEPAAFAAKIGGTPAPATAKPVNDVCPVSGEAAKPEHTSSFDGKLVAFCCKRCKAKFDADPAAFAAKLGGAPTPAKPVNDVCPVSGEAAKPEHTSTFDGKLVAFCCKRCKAKFDADPAAFAAKLGGAPTPAKPVNDVCPVSGEAAKPEHTSTFDGKLVAFCCKRCKAKFDAEPAAFAAKLR